MRWLADYGDPYEFVLEDADGLLGVELGVYGAPESFLLDATGRIIYKRVGEINPRIWRDEIAPLLNVLEVRLGVRCFGLTQPASGVPRLSALGLCLLLAAVPVGLPAAFAAGQVDVYEFPSPEMEARYRALIDEFRCPKCLNTNLSGSDAPIARDLRKTVWRLLVQEGMSDQEVRDFLQARYGDFVLYNPPFKPGTWLLWLAPVIFGLIGLLVLVRMLRKRPEVALSEADNQRVEALLERIEEKGA